jgi:ABC-type uncharacterized transport system substrate-binding protein
MYFKNIPLTLKLAGVFMLLLSVIIIILITVPDSAPISPGQTAHPPQQKFKILHIMSYHSPWEWTDTQLAGFKSALTDLNIEYKVFQMNTKRYSDEISKLQKAREARAIIDNWKPDLVYTSDDDVQKYIVRYYINREIPFVFSAVNADPKEYGFTGSRNVTGIMETEHFVESLALLREIVPQAKRIVIVTDDGAMWGPVLNRIKSRLNETSGIQIVRWDTLLTYAEYQQKLLNEYPKEADAILLLGIFSFKDAAGQNVPYQTVLEWTAKNSKLPDFSFWKDRVSFGTLCAVSVSGYEQGKAAGRIARAILVEGKSLINLARAKQLGIKIKAKVLLSSEIVSEYEWEK